MADFILNEQTARTWLAGVIEANASQGYSGIPLTAFRSDWRGTDLGDREIVGALVLGAQTAGVITSDAVASILFNAEDDLGPSSEDHCSFAVRIYLFETNRHVTMTGERLLYTTLFEDGRTGIDAALVVLHTAVSEANKVFSDVSFFIEIS